MRQRTPFLIIIIFILFITSACGRNTKENGEHADENYNDDEMIGTVSKVDKAGNTMIVDISDWESWVKKDQQLASYTVKMTDETVMKKEDGTEVSIDDIKNGQKVLINPPRDDSYEGSPEEIILSKMTYKEKYSEVLSHIDGYNRVVIYPNGEPIPDEMNEIMAQKASDILREQGHESVGRWIEYDKDFIVDYKEAFDIEQLPAILVFDTEELVFKTYKVEELYDFLKSI